MPSCAGGWNRNWPGCGQALAPARPGAAPGWTGTSRWPPGPRPGPRWTSRRSRSPGPRLGSLVVEATDLVKRFGGRALIDGLSFSIPPNGIVGPNGVGKTTLLRMILGQDRPDAGTISVGKTVRISYVDQMRAGIDPVRTVWEVISGGEAHSRWFLDRVATRILAWEGDSSWFWCEGNFVSYEQNKTERLGGEAARPHRVTHRKLTL